MSVAIERKENSTLTDRPLVVLFGTAAGPDTIGLVANPQAPEVPAQEVEEPFVFLEGQGVFFRTLLGQVAAAEGQLIPVLVKIQRDVPFLSSAPGFGRSYTNLQAEAAFVDEARCRQQLTGEGKGQLPSPSGVNCGRFAPAEMPVVSLPITYCKKIRAFFYPLCPRCGEYLADCRDEVLLGQSGLPSYSGSTRRFLYCAACTGNRDTKRIFYIASAGEPLAVTEQTSVRTGSELYRDWQVLVSTLGRESEANRGARQGLRQFPCLDCRYKGGCYPARPDSGRAILAEQMLHPVSYHEFRAIVLEFYALYYDELTQMLGGRPGAEIESMLTRRIPAAASDQPLVRSAAGLSSNSAHFFNDVDGTRSATEVLWLKLGAFEELCSGVGQIYQRCHRPHLDLHPRSVMASLDKVDPGQPPLWSFRVGVINPAAAVLVSAKESNTLEGPPAYLCPPDFQRLFTSPTMSRPPYGHEEYANVTVRAVTRTATGVEVEADLLSEVIGVFKLGGKDRLNVTLNAPGKSFDSLTFCADGARPIPSGYWVSGRAARVRPDVAEALAASTEQTFWDCRLNICRYYHLPCDLYSLGMMFLASLLVNDEHDQTEVCQGVEGVARTLTSFAAAAGPGESARIEQKLSELLAERRPLFAPSALFYRAADRRAKPDDLPAGLWFACQKLGFAMITEIPGFSICSGDDRDEVAEAPERIKNALDRLNDLNLWAEGRLFAFEAVRRELAGMAHR